MIINSENKNQNTYRLFILFEGGKCMQPEIVRLIADYMLKKGELEDIGTGNAYNMPDYLLGEIEGYEDTAVVVAWDWDGNTPHPRVLIGRTEIEILINELEADIHGDSWSIAVRVNKAIRAEESNSSMDNFLSSRFARPYVHGLLISVSICC